MRQQQRNLRRQTVLYRRIVSVMNAGFVAAIVVMAVGVLIGIVTGEHVDSETDALEDVLPGALRLKAQDIVEIGILILLATPVVYVIAALLTFARLRDRLFVGVCLALLGIVLLSLGVALL